MGRRSFPFLAIVLLLGWIPVARAQFAAAVMPASCGAAIAAAERTGRLPPRLLGAIALVESGRRDAGGSLVPWPWTINAQGVGHFFDSKADAIAYVKLLQKTGVQSIDVGCLQVNLMYHPEAFASLDQAFDPTVNAAYAARFLNQLHDQSGDWQAATAAYHSQTPDVGADYAKRVMALWTGNPATLDPSPGLSAPSLPAPITVAATASMPSLPSGRVAVMLPGGPAPMRVLPLAGDTSGHSLDAYRMRPIALATRQRGG